jgi:hypothetical protein
LLVPSTITVASAVLLHRISFLRSRRFDDLISIEPSSGSHVDKKNLLVTTLSHVVELQEIVGPNYSVLGLMYEPSYIDVLNEIIRLPNGTRVGLICPTKDAAKNSQQSLIERGVKHLRFVTAGIDKEQEVAKVFKEADQIYVSRVIIDRLNRKRRTDKRVHEYTTELEAVALRMLRREIAKARAALESHRNDVISQL